MKKINLNEAFSKVEEFWSPHIVGELNGQHVKVARLSGEFEWHSHANEDELFLVMSGVLKMMLRDRTIELHAGEFLVVPRGVEHRPVCDAEVQVLLFEPTSTVNTGDNDASERTRHKLPRHDT